jgi:signal transduction histidine kinase/ActR/RegA family two-component response regulator
MATIVSDIFASAAPSEDVARFRTVCRRTMIVLGLIMGSTFMLPVTAPETPVGQGLNLVSIFGFTAFALATLFEFLARRETIALLLLFVGAVIVSAPYLVTTGIGTAETAWLPFMVLCGCFVGGGRHGMLWTIAAAATAIASAAIGAEPHRGIVFELYNLGNARVYFGAIALVLIVGTYVFYVIFEGFYARSAARLNDANSELTAAVEQLETTLGERDALREQLVEGQKIESLGLMAGGLAHDFNNLLTGIIGELELAALDADEDGPVSESIAAAKESALAASDMTAALLSYAGRRPVERTNIDPVEVANFVRSIAGTATGRSVPIVVDAVESTRVFVGDRAQIEQVFLNLVMNAVQAMLGRDGEVVVSVGERWLGPDELARNRALTELEPGEYVVVEVADRGVGMERDVAARIFEPFFTSRDHGRGLGLAASLGIIRSHDAGIFVETRPGEGTTFRVVFPAIERPSNNFARASARWSVGREGTVLVVDDRPEVLSALTRLVESLGLAAVARSSPAEALALFEQNPGGYDVALIDVMMPEMRGDQLAQRLREMRDDLPVVFLSGYVDETDVLDDIPRAHFLGKPVRRAELKEVLIPTLQETGEFDLPA